MYDKIEKRLAEYEKRSPVTSDEELLEALSAIVSDERKKRRRCDLDLVNEATELSLSVKGYDVDKIKERGREIARRETAKLKEEKPAKTFRPTRLFILIPAVALLVAMMTVVASSSEGHMFTKGEIENMEPGKVYEIDGGDVIISKETINDIESLEELERIINDPNVILPFGIEEEYPITYISFADYVSYKNVIILMPDSVSETGIVIGIGKPLYNDYETIRVGRLDICFVQYEDEQGTVYCADFQYKDSSYSVRTHSQEQLDSIIKIFKEQCDENG